ncbi:MAG: ATP-binding protein [Holophagae bacterium]|jgi:MinD superfamily P-loop ATPase
MIIAIASGKGGTGKTTVAVNLALTVGHDVHLLDCDVEAPNAHLFLGAQPHARVEIGIPVPEIDHERCTLCAECSRVCQFNAVAVLGSRAVVFPELCHGCGACTLLCPERAISETSRCIGVIEESAASDVRLIQGRLNVGEALVPPLIRQVRARARHAPTVLVDAPPGTSCTMIAAVRGADTVVLVTEPTPFGLNDLRLAVETVRTLDLPCGVVINRSGAGDDRVHAYCAAEQLDILAEIPDDRRIAEAYSRGLPIVEAVPETRSIFADLADRLGLPNGRARATGEIRASA